MKAQTCIVDLGYVVSMDERSRDVATRMIIRLAASMLDSANSLDPTLPYYTQRPDRWSCLLRRSDIVNPVSGDALKLAYLISAHSGFSLTPLNAANKIRQYFQYLDGTKLSFYCKLFNLVRYEAQRNGVITEEEYTILRKLISTDAVPIN